MHPKSYPSTQCPMARTLAVVGEWWTLLILRDAFQGLARFDEFQASLGIAPNILSRRLAHLTAEGLLERRRYSERPPRHEYRLTAKGRDLFPALMALMTWGNRHLAPEGPAVLLAARRDGRKLRPVVVDAASREPITPRTVALVPGPAAGPGMRARLASNRALRLSPRLEARS